jgi:hypothetical protein
MDSVFSTRMDESVARRVRELAFRLGVSKKSLVERALRELAERIEEEDGLDVFDVSCGAWKRDESPAEVRKEARRRFNEAMERRRG